MLTEMPDTIQPAPVPTPSRAPIVALSCIAAVFALVAITFTGLYLTERTERDRTASARIDKEKELLDSGMQEIAARDELERNQKREEGLNAQHRTLMTCSDAAKLYMDLPATGESTPESSRLFRIMYDVCPYI